MVVRVFMSGVSGNKDIVTHQQRIFMILNSLGIECEPVDIAAPGMDEARDYMRKYGKKKEDQRNVLPPQIFNGEKYCGDYEDFDLANEDDVLEEFLGIPRKTPKAEGAGGATEDNDVGKLAKEGEDKPASVEEPMDQALPVEKSEELKDAEEQHEECSPESAPEASAAEPQSSDQPDESGESELVEPEQNAAEAIPTKDVVADEEDQEEETATGAQCKNHEEVPENTQKLDETVIGQVEPCVISQEKLIDELDHEQTCGTMKNDHDPTIPGSSGYEEHMKKLIAAEQAEKGDEIQDISALGPVFVEELPMAPAKKKLTIEVDEKRAAAGFQDIKNASRFWKASQIMGTP